MIDIETLDSSPTAAVIAIGACVFTDGLISDSVSVIIDAEAAQIYGTTSDAAMGWWAHQDPEVRQRMFAGKIAPRVAAAEFSVYVRAQRVDEVWANAPTFDLSILRHLYTRLGMRVPWHYRDERCVRTVYALAKELGINYA